MSEAGRAAARSGLFRLFAAALEYPDDALCDAVLAGAFAVQLQRGLAAIDPALARALDAGAVAPAGDATALRVEYTRLFDGVTPGAASLHMGVYGGARMRELEELLRFYRWFGLQLAESPRELPDHLATQLEFLHFLAFREVEALRTGADAAALRRAQRDFIARHPGRRVPALVAQLERLEAAPFFRALLEALARLLGHEARALEAQTGAPCPAG